MKIPTTALLLGILTLTAPCPADQDATAPAPPPADPAAFDHAHAQWTGVLAEHVHGDRFDYGALKKDPGALNAYLERLGGVPRAELQSWSSRQRMAFWINLYNAAAVSLVADNYPLESILDLNTLTTKVWDKRFIALQPGMAPKRGERRLSLNDVEHEILRPRFEDARVHAAINCASESCPPLRGEAFVAERLDQQLDEQVALWLADPTRNRFEREKSTLQLSEIFNWFEEDFVRDAGSVRKWVAARAPEPQRAWLASPSRAKIRFLPYSWKLNDHVGAARSD